MSWRSTKWQLVFAAMFFVGLAVFLTGILLFPTRPLVFIVGMVIIAFGLNLWIAAAYKSRTGKDHPGTKFWKRVFGIKGDD